MAPVRHRSRSQTSKEHRVGAEEHPADRGRRAAGGDARHHRPRPLPREADHRRHAGGRPALGPGPGDPCRRVRRSGGHHGARGPRGAAALHRPRDGPGRAAAAPGRQARHRPVHHGRLLLRLRRRRALHPRGPQADLLAHAEDREVRPDLPPPRRGRGDRPRRDGGRALQARAARQEGRRGHRRRGRLRGGRGRGDHHLRQRGPQDRRRRVVRPLPRPAPALHQAHRQRLRAHPLRRRLLARQREEQAAAAHLRHRVGQQGRPQGLPGAPRRGRAPRPPQARRRAGSLLLPGRARLRPARVPPARRHHPQGDGGLLPSAPHRGRLRVRLHPAHHQAAPLRGVRPPRLVRGRHVPAHAHRRGP